MAPIGWGVVLGQMARYKYEDPTCPTWAREVIASVSGLTGNKRAPRIPELLAKRKRLQQELAEVQALIERTCNHPLKVRVLDAHYITDTIGMKGRNTGHIRCEECGHTLGSYDEPYR